MKERKAHKYWKKKTKKEGMIETELLKVTTKKEWMIEKRNKEEKIPNIKHKKQSKKEKKGKEDSKSMCIESPWCPLETRLEDVSGFFG